jgi:peroxiredoxin
MQTVLAAGCGIGGVVQSQVAGADVDRDEVYVGILYPGSVTTGCTEQIAGHNDDVRSPRQSAVEMHGDTSVVESSVG